MDGYLKAKQKDLKRFTIFLNYFLEKGKKIDESIELLEGMMETQAMRKALQIIRNKISNGGNIYEALNNHKDIFPDYYIKIFEIYLINNEDKSMLKELMNLIIDNDLF